MCGGLPPINLPAAFGGDIGSADGGRREADEDDAALAERMSPRSIMSDEVKPALQHELCGDNRRNLLRTEMSALGVCMQGAWKGGWHEGVHPCPHTQAPRASVMRYLDPGAKPDILRINAAMRAACLLRLFHIAFRRQLWFASSPASALR